MAEIKNNEIDDKDDKKHAKSQLKSLKPEPTVPPKILAQIDEMMRRIRLLEERYSGLRKKAQFTEQNMLKDAKDLFGEHNILQETVTELTSQVSDLNEKLTRLNDEVQNSVSKADFNVLSKYMDFWQPMSFLTRKEAMDLLVEHFGEKTDQIKN